MTTITNILALPTGPLQGTGTLGIVITPNVPSYFEVQGVGINDITHVAWYPLNPESVEFETRQLICVDSTKATFMIRVTNNFLSVEDRGGRISFRLADGSTISYPVKTYGPVSYSPLWQSPYQGINTG
jgi:hypothetical protein